MTLLPESYEEDTIANMLPGEKGYTVPWAMWADDSRVLWIHGGYSVVKKPHGTAHMKIQRTELGVIVFQATIGDHRYQPGGSSFVGSVMALPVEELW